jgi:hypothetical protein
VHGVISKTKFRLNRTEFKYLKSIQVEKSSKELKVKPERRSGERKLEIIFDQIRSHTMRLDELPRDRRERSGLYRECWEN